MINRFTNNKLLHFFWMVLAFFLLNSSIDIADEMPSHIAEDLSYNEQESIVELILEEMLGIEDAIPESEDNDASQNSTLKKASGIDHYVSIAPAIKHRQYIILPNKQYLLENVAIHTADHTEIVSPPPES